MRAARVLLRRLGEGSERRQVPALEPDARFDARLQLLPAIGGGEIARQLGIAEIGAAALLGAPRMDHDLRDPALRRTLEQIAQEQVGPSGVKVAREPVGAPRKPRSFGLGMSGRAAAVDGSSLR